MRSLIQQCSIAEFYKEEKAKRYQKLLADRRDGACEMKSNERHVKSNVLLL